MRCVMGACAGNVRTAGFVRLLAIAPLITLVGMARRT